MRSVKELIQEIKSAKPREFSALDILDSNLVELSARIAKLEARNLQYFCTAYRATNFSIPSGVATPIPLTETVPNQFGNMHDDAIDNEKIFIRRNGVYALHSTVIFNQTNPMTPGRYVHSLSILRDGGTFRFENDEITLTLVVDPSHIDTKSFQVNMIEYCYEGDAIQASCFQNTGLAQIIQSQSLPNAKTVVSVMERREDLTPAELGLLDPDAHQSR